MGNLNSIMNVKNYGKIVIKLKNIMTEKDVSKNKLSVLTGVKFDTIQKYYNSNVYRIDVDVLAKFCFALNCEIEDIVEYLPNSK